MSTKLGSAHGEVIIDTSKSEKSISGLERSVGGLIGGFAGINPILGATTIALGGLAAAGGGLAVAIGSSVSVAAELEAQLDAVQAVSGTTAGEMEQLKGLIENLGVDKNLKVSAQEAADAIERLVSNGLTAQEVLDGAARSTVLLANATGAQFNDAADIATDTMAIFGIEAADMERAVDGITSVVNASKFSIQDYQLALAQGGGVAAATGVEFEDFNTTIAAISPYFDARADAAVSYKTLLQRLIPQSKDAAKSMKQLGIITEDGSNQFFDAQGNLKGMAEIAGILQDALSGLTEEQRNNALATIFGQDAQRAAVALAEVGAEKFKELQATMAQTDAADAAATRMDNLAGSLDILGGIIETIKIRIGNEFIPVLKQGVDQAAGFLEGNADSIVAFFGSIATGTGIAISELSKFLPVLLAFGQYVIAVVEDGDTLNDWLTHLPEGLQPFALMIGNLIATVSTELPGLITTVTNFLSEMITAFNEGGLSGLAEKFWEWITGGEGVEATAGGMINRAIAAITQAINDNWPAINAALNEWSNKFWDWLLEAINKSGEKLLALVAAIQEWANQPDTQANLQGLGYSLGLALYDGLILLMKNTAKATEALTAIATTLAAASLALAPTLVEMGTSVAGGFIAGIIKKITGADTSAEMQSKLGELWSNVVQAVITSVIPGTALAFATENFIKMKEEFDKLDFGAIGSDLVGRLADGITGAIGWVRDAVSKLIAEFNPLKGIELPYQLTANSPTPFETGIRGISKAISAMPNLGAPFANLPGSDRFAGVSDIQSIMNSLTVPPLPDLPLSAALPAAGEAGGNTLNGNIVFEISGAQSPVAVAGEVEKVLQNLFGKARRPAFG